MIHKASEARYTSNISIIIIILIIEIEHASIINVSINSAQGNYCNC